MVRRLLLLERSFLQTRTATRTAKVLIEPFSQNVYNRITKNSYRQRIKDDFKEIPIGKDYLRARDHARKGSFDAIKEFRNKYEKYGFNENIPFYLYPRFVYLICTSHEVPGF